MKHLIPFVIYCTLVACMTVATFVAKGSDVASISIYGSWWFIGGWIFLVLASAFLFWNILRIKKANLLNQKKTEEKVAVATAMPTI